MKLSKLLESVPVKRITDHNKIRQDSMPDMDIRSIHYRAQDVKPGGLFVAVAGFSADGHDFIDEALAKGATAVLTQKKVRKDSIIIEVENTRKGLAAISSRFYQNPSEQLFITGITGTNGKTTTAFLIESIFLGAGFKTGVIGTINYRYSGKTFNNPMTTPESLDLQMILARMLAKGVTHVVMEVSSHAIDLHRIDNCCFDVGVFTNLSQDHLDYHKDMHSYWLCKKKMFTQILNEGPKKDRAIAVINCNDTHGKELSGILSVSCLTIGYSKDNMIRPDHIKYSMSGIAGKISTGRGALQFKSSLLGKHNLENILCATGVGIAFDLPLDVIKAGIEDLSFVPGRLEPVLNDAGKFVYIDYAHTPDALENVLTCLKAVKQGKIICIFGCGGDRDKKKRFKMGEIAGRHSDLVIITSDNPRSEDPIKIIAQVAEGTKKVCQKEYTLSDIIKGFSGKGYVVEADRKNAIRLGINASAPGDTIIIAGKGHETSQIIGSKSIAFDDKKEAQKALFTQT